MGFFSKRKNDNDGFIINTDNETIKISGDKNLAPHAMTVDEVSNLWVFNDEDDQTPINNNALSSLKKRMTENAQENVIASTKQAEEKTQTEKTEAPVITEQKDLKDATQKSFAGVDEYQKTLLEKLQRYTVDEHGHDLSKSTEPLYHLESVAEIIKNDSEKTIENLSKKYDISIEDLRKPSEKSVSKPEEKPKENLTVDKGVPTTAFKQMVSDAEKREEELLYQSISQTDSSDKASPDDTTIIDIPDISDIDNNQFGIVSENPISSTATIRFTPIKDNKGNTDHITISSITQHIDLGETVVDNQKTITTDLEQSEFEKFEPKTKINNLASAKKELRQLAFKKRSAFFGIMGSLISLIALLVFLIPPVFDFIIVNPKSTMFVCGGFLLLSILSNFNILFDFSNLFKNKGTANIFMATASIFTLSLSVCAALTNQNAYYIILLCDIILFIRSICNFMFISSTQGNLKQISNENVKNAVTLIDDSATTFSMAKNAIEGDVLVCAYKKTNFVEDFTKYSTFTQSLSNRLVLVFYLSVILAIFSGVIAFFYYDGIFDMFYSATSVLLFASTPTLFFIDVLPLCSAAKRLNAKGAMIAGLYGAEKIESTNAVVISVNDIFPEGTVSMYSMKVLSNNNIDQTILKAASLTAAVNSPLESIFKQIAGTNSSYSIPDSDTVKYEKRLGISGWVDDELLFIGNRSLMEAHGIEIPSIEVDKKILRRGYFPVYVATENTACALIVIQYDVRRDIAKELRKTTELGVTLLIDNCDPNINEDMLCDYFGLYKDSIKIMTNAGVYMYKTVTPFTESCSAPAAFRGSGINLIKIINCASKIKIANRILTILYSIFAVLGVLYFIYASFSGITEAPQQTTLLLYTLATTVLSIIGFLIRKP